MINESLQRALFKAAKRAGDEAGGFELVSVVMGDTRAEYTWEKGPYRYRADIDLRPVSELRWAEDALWSAVFERHAGHMRGCADA